jgi:heme a synthase
MRSLVAGVGARAPQLPRVPPSTFRRISIVSLVCVGAIVLTGAAVRLTGSGLGCSDWPTCTTGHLTPPLRYHSLIEFSNRMVTVVLVVVIGATFLAALLRRPFRRDLAWLSAGLIAGVLAEAVIGGIVVYSKLNPYLVMVHFLATVALLVDAVVLVHRADRDYSVAGRPLVPRPVLLLSRGLLVLVAGVLTAGAATTGAAPDGGSAQGQIIKRIAVPLREMAELHSTLALFLIGVVVSLAVLLHALSVPERVRKAARMLVVVLVLQAVVGYAQYFTHLPAALVEVHELGATVLVIGVVQYFLALTHHAPERIPAQLRAVPDLATEVGIGALGAASAPGAAEGTATVHS